MFDPTVGRWLEEDPIGFEGGDADLYRFVGNDPTNATDPTGLWEDADAERYAKTQAERVARGQIPEIAGITPKGDPYGIFLGPVQSQRILETDAGDLTVTVRFPTTYANFGRGDSSPGMFIGVHGKEADKVSFVQFLQAFCWVERGGTTSTESAVFGAKPEHWHGGDPLYTTVIGEGDASRTEWNRYLDARRTPENKVGFVESGFIGHIAKTGEVDSWMWDRPTIANMVLTWWNDRYWKQPAVSKIRGELRFDTYVLVGGKPYYRITWSATATITRSSLKSFAEVGPPQLQLTTLPQQTIEGGTIRFVTGFQGDEAFQHDEDYLRAAAKQH
jgi:hypothetical protein